MTTASAFGRKLGQRAAAARIVITASQIAQLEKYYELLRRWNARMNLTALALEGLPDKTIDRLFIEPLAAARYVSSQPITWVDIGSGGGSPAIPLKVVRPHAHLTMTESKGRKAAFLREVTRALELKAVDVQSSRFEALFDLDRPRITADLITLRAVKADSELLRLCRTALKLGGELLRFSSGQDVEPHYKDLKHIKNVRLTEDNASLDVFRAT